MRLYVATISVIESETLRPQRALSVTKLTKAYVRGRKVLRTFTEIVATCKINMTQGQGSSLMHIYTYTYATESNAFKHHTSSMWLRTN